MPVREPFPLAWPPGWKRTHPSQRSRSRFRNPSLNNAIREIRAELDRMKASHIVVTSNLPTRNDGLPYASGRADDPAIAVWFVRGGRELVIACDRWLTPGENMRSIAKSVAALRGLVRWGSSQIVDHAFAGFAALPAGTPDFEPVRHWRETFDVESFDGLPKDALWAIVRDRYKRLALDAHPDRGGSESKIAALNAAYAEAEADLTTRDDEDAA